MKIGILLYPYGEKNPAGLGAYVLNLTKALLTLHADWQFFLFTKGEHDTIALEKFKNATIVPMPDTIFWKDIACLRHKEIDVWLYNNPNLPFFITPKKSLVTALDFGLFYPKEEETMRGKVDQLVNKWAQYISLRKTTHVACTSFATKKDLHRFFPRITDDKASVVMCGYTRVCDVYDEDTNLLVPDKYYLLVGVIKRRKNQLTAIKAFTRAKEKGLQGKLLICGKGKGTYFDTVMAKIASSPFKEDIVYLGYRSNEELVTLYKNAHALVFPSHVEGFGMPILEAMSCGTPVITSSNNALGEAAGDAALTVDSSDVEGFADAMLRLDDRELRETLIKKGSTRSTEFSWERSAVEYGNIFRMLALENIDNHT